MDKYLLAFAQLKGIGPVTLKKVLQLCSTPEEAYNVPLSFWEQQKLSPKLARILTDVKQIKPDQLWQELLNNDIKATSETDSDYPKNFKNLNSAPAVLYYRGDLTILNNKTLGVVGSRKISVYARQIMPELLKPLAGLNLTIASGLAYGVDKLAHQIALDISLPTVGILGSGLNWKVFYPQDNRKIAEQILESGGLIISEMPPSYEAMPFDFPRRNRLIACLSDAVLVVEAADKSGALITGRLAAEQGKDVLAVPQNINSANSGGTNRLLQNGATIALSSQDISDSLGLNGKQTINIKAQLPNLTITERQIYNFLSTEPTSLDQLIEENNFEQNGIGGVLINLELKGLIKNIGGQNYIRN